MRYATPNVYHETIESHELFLTLINDGYFVNQHTACVLKSLKRKYRKGIYDEDKAIKAYYNLATTGAKYYTKEFGGVWNYLFDVTARYTCAVEMEKFYFDRVKGDA